MKVFLSHSTVDREFVERLAALILQDWGKLDEAMALHKEKEKICVELGNKDGLQISYGNEANILEAQGRADEATSLREKRAEILRELGKASD